MEKGSRWLNVACQAGWSCTGNLSDELGFGDGVANDGVGRSWKMILASCTGFRPLTRVVAWRLWVEEAA